jgi:hypothetical protein
MIPIFIDMGDISEAFELDQVQVDDMKELAIKRVALGFEAQWKATAGQKLGKTREIYKNAIRTEFRSPDTAVVYLDPTNWLANALEMGYSSFDMKKRMLKSDKVKFTKDGDPYITIPFRFATPSAIGDNSAFSGKLPKEVYERIKSAPKGKRLSLGEIPQKYHIPKSRALRTKITEISALTSKEKTSIYEGVTKTGGGYMSFRRISLNSHDESWQHPGFEARDFSGEALAEFEPTIGDIVSNSIDDFLDNLGV